MTLLVRTVLVCLLAFAVPLQGAVAAAMRCCGMEHHQVGAPSSGEVFEHGHESAHEHGGQLGAERLRGHTAEASAEHLHSVSVGQHSEAAHDHAFAHEDASAAGELAGGKTAEKSPAKASAKCSVCASCCGAAALPTRGSSLSPTAVEKDRLIPSATPDAEFSTDGPERPPRTSSL